MRRFQEPTLEINDDTWVSYRTDPSLFKQKFSSLFSGKWVSFLWYVRRRREGRGVFLAVLRSVLHMSLFHNLSYEKRKRFNGGREEEERKTESENLQSESQREKGGEDGDVASITLRSGH